MFDQRTDHFDLELPDLRNPLSVDVGRLRDMIGKVDAALFGLTEEAEENSTNRNSPDHPVYLNEDGKILIELLLAGVKNGLATLDSTGKVPADQLPETLPTGVMLDYGLKSLPSDGWRFCDGAALLASDTLAASLRAKLLADGSPNGVDSGGNPLLPDARGRSTVGRDDMGGIAAGRVTTIDGNTLGASGGAETHRLTLAQMAKHGHTVMDPGHGHSVYDPGHAHSVYDPGHAHALNFYPSGSNQTRLVNGNASNGGASASGSTTSVGTGISIYAAGTNISIYANTTGITIAQAGNDEAHNNLPPSLIVNKIIKL